MKIIKQFIDKNRHKITKFNSEKDKGLLKATYP